MNLQQCSVPIPQLSVNLTVDIQQFTFRCSICFKLHEISNTRTVEKKRRKGLCSLGQDFKLDMKIKTMKHWAERLTMMDYLKWAVVVLFFFFFFYRFNLSECTDFHVTTRAWHNKSQTVTTLHSKLILSASSPHFWLGRWNPAASCSFCLAGWRPNSSCKWLEPGTRRCLTGCTWPERVPASDAPEEETSSAVKKQKLKNNQHMTQTGHIQHPRHHFLFASVTFNGVKVMPSGYF